MKRMTWLALALLLSVASLSAQAQSGYVTVNLNMRAAPDIDYPLITTLRVGSAISVLGCVDDYQWCDVTAYGERGWISGDYIEYEYQNRRVPLYGYGVQIGIPIISFVIGDYWGSHYNHRSFYRDRDRWYRHPINYRSSSHHRRNRHDDRRDSRRDDRHGNRHDSHRDDRHDNRHDGRRDARHDNRNDHRSDGRSADLQNTRRTNSDSANTGVKLSPRSTGRHERSAASRQQAAEPRRVNTRQSRDTAPSPRSDASHNQRQGRSNPPAQGQQRDRRDSNHSNNQERGKRDDKDKKDNKGDKDRRHH
jgi:uncharacterized protein YraI